MPLPLRNMILYLLFLLPLLPLLPLLSMNLLFLLPLPSTVYQRILPFISSRNSCLNTNSLYPEPKDCLPLLSKFPLLSKTPAFQQEEVSNVHFPMTRFWKFPVIVAHSSFQDCDQQWIIKKLKSPKWVVRSNFLKLKTKVLMSALDNLKMKTVVYRSESVCRTRDWLIWRLSKMQTFRDCKIAFKITYLVLQVHLTHTIPKINSPFLACQQKYLKMITVRCQVCNQLRNHEKYARHLTIHINNGEISTREMKEILFQTKYTRKDKSVKNFNITEGYTCGLCGNIVQDLSKHVAKIHQIDTKCDEFSKLRDDSVTFKRINHYKVTSEANLNPLFDYSKLRSVLIPKVLPDVISQNITASIPVNSSIFEYSDTEEEQSDDITTSSDVFNINKLESHNSKDLVQAIGAFKNFLSTKWGGSKSPRCIQMEISNICRLVNGAGLNKFFDPHAINFILSEETKGGKTPITIHSRVKSYERFIRYLKSVNSILIPKTQDLDQLSFMISGVGKSLLKERNNRQKVVMSDNRKRYDHAVQVLQVWREKRHQNSLIDVFQDFYSQPNVPLTEDKFRRLRNFLVTEILLANGQRSGVISGMLVEEIFEGEKHITPEGHHKIMVSNHKTGAQQAATLFIYKNIFDMLVIFVKHVLPKLTSKDQSESKHVFQTFEGAPISSSVVTRIVRSGLLDLGIAYMGTVNDFRRAAATLTGKFNPNLSEKMALFMGHSRRVHDKHYRVQLGHSGLVDAFNTLEKMQTKPFSDELSEPFNDSVLTKNIEISHIPKSIESSSLVSEYNFEDIMNSSQCLIGQKDTPIHQIHQLSIPVSPISTSFQNNQSSLDDIIPSTSLNQSSNILFHDNLSHSSNNVQHPSDSKSFNSCKFILSYPSSSEGLETEVDITVDPIPFSSKFGNSGYSNNLKECQILIHPISPKCISRGSSYDLRRRINHSKTSLNLRCNSIFAFPEDEEIFLATFKSYIHRVKDQSRVSKSEVTQRAKTSVQFSPVLDRLYSLNSGDIYQQLYNRIRTLGIQLRKNISGTVRKNILTGSQMENDSVSSSLIVQVKAHHKSIFQFQHEEDLFFEVFSDLINLVKNKQFVVKKQIIARIYESKEFSPLLEKLLKIHSSIRVEQIIVNKTRSSGYNLRKY